MNFIADLHIHSRFSRATSKALNPRHLAAWARCKGINVLGTGDFTHPQWRAELAEQLVLDEHTGLYRLAVEPEPLEFMDAKAGPGMRESTAPLFLLQTEISSIYKRGGKVRKVHNLVFVPTLEDAERLSLRLAQIGNLNADGRPILGLDSRDLLEIMLECAPGSVMMPMCGRPGLRFSAPNQALTGLKTVTAIFRNTFLRWKRAFRPTLP